MEAKTKLKYKADWFYRILKANLSWTRKKSNSNDAKNYSFLYFSFFRLKPNFRYSNLSFVRLSWGRITENLQITGKVSLELDSNSSLLLENGRKFIYFKKIYPNIQYWKRWSLR